MLSRLVTTILLAIFTLKVSAQFAPYDENYGKGRFTKWEETQSLYGKIMETENPIFRIRIVKQDARRTTHKNPPLIEAVVEKVLRGDASFFEKTVELVWEDRPLRGQSRCATMSDFEIARQIQEDNQTVTSPDIGSQWVFVNDIYPNNSMHAYTDMRISYNASLESNFEKAALHAVSYKQTKERERIELEKQTRLQKEIFKKLVQTFTLNSNEKNTHTLLKNATLIIKGTVGNNFRGNRFRFEKERDLIHSNLDFDLPKQFIITLTNLTFKLGSTILFIIREISSFFSRTAKWMKALL